MNITWAWVLKLVIGLCVVLTALSGLVIGWLAVEFQFFGASPTAEDFEVAAGAYAASAGVLMLGALAARSSEAPRWMVVWALGWAAMLVFLALSSVSDASATLDPGLGSNGWQDGAGGALACPWTWPLVLLGAYASLRRRRPVTV
ncbi:MAG: hypothetical protein ACR2HA_08920 [Nocardioides sp.]